jgi:hypothetical protein
VKKNVAVLLVLVLALLLTVGLFSVKAESFGNDWVMFQHDPARTGFSSGTVETPAKTWNASQSYPLWSSPAVAEGFVYIKSEYIECLNASTGTSVWLAPTTRNVQELSSIAVVDGYVYSGSFLYADFGGDVYSLNASTGDRI